SSRRRHTRFSRDWSSDVCSSDLPILMKRASLTRAIRQPMHARSPKEKPPLLPRFIRMLSFWRETHASILTEKSWKSLRMKLKLRSEERRVGKECRYRGVAYTEKE